MKYTQLLNAVNNINGASFIGLDTLTEVKLTGGKKNPMQGKVTKKSVGNSVMVFTNKNTNSYEDMVQRRLIQEGKDPTTFEVGPRAWGTRVPNLPIVEHFKDDETRYYLEAIFLKAGTNSYFFDGKPIEKEKIEGLPAEREVVEDVGQAGLKNKVVIRTFLADSITEIRVDGKVFN